MQVAFYLAGEKTQIKESIPWVRCASGNVWLSSPPLARSCNKMSGWQHQWNSLQCFWFFAAVEFYLQLWRQHPVHLSLATPGSKTQICKMLPYPCMDIWIYPEESSLCLYVAGTSVTEAMLWCPRGFTMTVLCALQSWYWHRRHTKVKLNQDVALSIDINIKIASWNSDSIFPFVQKLD